mmetsp:Transcript_113757/g.178998  ORF Transcript_113757/g.178998 Transcript_113757/m.178998 type:complete len:242 (+) Transcript_113757:49-774(+)
MRQCKNPNCEYPVNSDPSVSVDFCCDKCEARFNGDPWGSAGKKKHTAYCSSHASDNTISSTPLCTTRNEPPQKCANPCCDYEWHSDKSVSLLYCCEKCEGIHKREPWAEGGKAHYKSCEKKVFVMRWGENWTPSAVEEPQERVPLERHQGAERDTRPAWMTKGVGINQNMFGETKGDMIKPGMTRADLDMLEKKVCHSSGYDPLADFMNESSGPRSRSRSPVTLRRAPLPDQKEAYWAEWK